MEEILIPIVAIVSIFVVFPAILFNSMTQWKKSRSLSVEDENLMDELYDLARRLTERVETVERIVAADNPNFRTGLGRQDGYAALADEQRAQRQDDLLGRRDHEPAPRGRFDRH